MSWSPSARERERRAVRQRLRRRGLLVAALATVVFFGVLVTVVVTSPGWPTVRATFFDWHHARESFPSILEGFWKNVRMFLIAQPIILALGLAIALARQSRAPWLVPVRALAVAWTDVFRGIPTLVLVFLLVFGMPSLGLSGLPTGIFFWATVALVISYSAYVAEVFRSGIESIHPSQVASAQALGLSRAQALRFVVVPQAVRRVVPPLLNDFISLQKDTALVASVSLFDALYSARDYANYNFNFTPYVVVALFFIVMTVPLARFTDWLSRRYRERERAGAL
ncbi:amino acid ABC transporter permease [Nocardioides sp. SYSU D00038]|uniref:amino acid ABC transporter permease n=1 Tax=Nocardioides sp. SYSU D00038 TaxID=2812554 RepID=UPI001967D445|nr:amino acid ABC transporter permease [Nocardioides sp. SYSU D00038]